MSEELLDELEAKQTKLPRPEILTIICFFTWVGCIVLFLFTFTLLAGSFQTTFGEFDLLLLVVLLSTIGSATGSIMMFLGVYRGFWIYSISQFVYAFIVGKEIVGTNGVDLSELALALFFVGIPLGWILAYESQSHYFRRSTDVSTSEKIDEQ